MREYGTCLAASNDRSEQEPPFALREPRSRTRSDFNWLLHGRLQPSPVIATTTVGL